MAAKYSKLVEDSHYVMLYSDYSVPHHHNNNIREVFLSRPSWRLFFAWRGLIRPGTRPLGAITRCSPFISLFTLVYLFAIMTAGQDALEVMMFAGLYLTAYDFSRSMLAAGWACTGVKFGNWEMKNHRCRNHLHRSGYPGNWTMQNDTVKSSIKHPKKV